MYTTGEFIINMVNDVLTFLRENYRSGKLDLHKVHVVQMQLLLYRCRM